MLFKGFVSLEHFTACSQQLLIGNELVSRSNQHAFYLVMQINGF